MEQATSTYGDILGVRIGSWNYDGPSVEDQIALHLTYIGDVDLSEPDYSFDLLRFYVRKRDGAVLYATDSGCSCPSPFEDVTVGELKETVLDRVEDVARSEHSDGYGSVPLPELLKSVRDLMPKMREAGAV